MKKIFLFIIIVLVLIFENSFAQEYDYDEIDYSDLDYKEGAENNSNNYDQDQYYYDEEHGDYNQNIGINCGTNKDGNEYCTYSPTCYEYFNKNGTHYINCPNDDGLPRRPYCRNREYLYNNICRNQKYMDQVCQSKYPETIYSSVYECTCPTVGTIRKRDWKPDVYCDNVNYFRNYEITKAAEKLEMKKLGLTEQEYYRRKNIGSLYMKSPWSEEVKIFFWIIVAIGGLNILGKLAEHIKKNK